MTERHYQAVAGASGLTAAERGLLIVLVDMGAADERGVAASWEEVARRAGTSPRYLRQLVAALHRYGLDQDVSDGRWTLDVNLLVQASERIAHPEQRIRCVSRAEDMRYFREALDPSLSAAGWRWHYGLPGSAAGEGGYELTRPDGVTAAVLVERDGPSEVVAYVLAEGVVLELIDADFQEGSVQVVDTTNSRRVVEDWVRHGEDSEWHLMIPEEHELGASVRVIYPVGSREHDVPQRPLIHEGPRDIDLGL